MDLVNKLGTVNTSSVLNIINKKRQKTEQEPSFSANPISDNKEISSVTPDYNINAPIGYNYTGDIKISDTLTAKTYKLANGQKVVILPKKGPTVITTYVNTGSLNEPDNVRGISHYIEHNLFNGSEALGDKEFFKEIDKMGAYTNASTSFGITDYIIESNLLEDSELEEQIKLQAAQVQTPKFLIEKLEKEKDIVNSEINMYMSDDFSRAYSQTIKNLFNIQSTSADLIAGTTNNITALTRDDVVKYFNDNYYPANMVTVITGDVDSDNTINLVAKYFNSKKGPSNNRIFEQLTPIQKPIRQDIISTKNKNSATIIMGFAGPENSNAIDDIRLSALTGLLSLINSSRNSDTEKKYATSIVCGGERLNSKNNQPNLFTISTSVNEENVEPMLQDIYKNITNIINNPPTEEEMQAVKNSMLKIIDRHNQSSGRLNRAIGINMLNGTADYICQEKELINNLTSQDLVDVAKKYLDLNKVAITVVHPANTTEDTINRNYSNKKSVSFTGSMNKTPLDLSHTTKYKLNNYEIIFNDVDSDIVNYTLSYDKSDKTIRKPSLNAVVSEMLYLNGTNNKSNQEISKIQDVNGIQQAESLGFNDYEIGSNFPVNSADAALNLLKEKMQNQEFTQELLDKAIKNCRDNYLREEPSEAEDYRMAIYGKKLNRYRLSEKIEGLNNITLDDVKEYYNDILSNSSGQIVVSGPFSKHPDLKNRIFNEVAAYNNVKPIDISLKNVYTPIENTEVYTTEYNKNQANIRMGYKFKINGNLKDDVTLTLLNNILGESSSSRLFNDLREKRHLAYHVSSSIDKNEDMGVITLRIGTTTENLETGETSYDNIKKSIDGFKENIQKICSENVTEEELESAKRTLKNSLLNAMEMNNTKDAIMVSNNQNIYGLNYPNEKYKIIDSITADDIRNAANYIFAGKPIYSIAATKSTFENNREYLDRLKR